MAIRSCTWGGRYGNLEITRLCCMYGARSSVEECSLLWLRSVCFLRFLRCEGSICRRPYHQDRHLLREWGCRPRRWSDHQDCKSEGSARCSSNVTSELRCRKALRNQEDTSRRPQGLFEEPIGQVVFMAPWGLQRVAILREEHQRGRSTRGCVRARRGRLAVTWVRRPRGPPSSCACPRASPSGPLGWNPFRTRRTWKVFRRCAGTCVVSSLSCGWTAWGTPRTCTACPPSALPCAPETKVWLEFSWHWIGIFNCATISMKRRVSWLIYMPRINIVLSFYRGPSIILVERMFNLKIFQSLPPSLFILSLPPKLVWINQIPRHLHVVICSVADLSKITKSPRKISQFWILLLAKLNFFYVMPSHFVAIGRIGQSFITLSQLVKFSHETSWGEKLIQCQAELKWLREIEGGKGFGGKVVDRRFNASAKWGKHERKYWAAEEKKDKERRNILNGEFGITSAWLPATNGFCAIRRCRWHYFLRLSFLASD